MLGLSIDTVPAIMFSGFFANDQHTSYRNPVTTLVSMLRLSQQHVAGEQTDWPCVPRLRNLKNLTFDDKVFTLRKIVAKIVATKDEVTICGLIPLTDSLVA